MSGDTMKINDCSNKVLAATGRLHALGITTLKTFVRQSPTKANQDVAICQSDAEVNGKSVSMCGWATPETSGSDKPHVLLDDAAHSSLRMVERSIWGMRSPSTSPPAPSTGETTAARPQNNDQQQWKHSSKKPMSDKQRECIQGIAGKNGVDIEHVARETVGKNLDTCTSADADRIIKTLNRKPPF